MYLYFLNLQQRSVSMKVSIIKPTLYKTLFLLREPKAAEECHYQSTCKLCFFTGQKGIQASSTVKTTVVIIFKRFTESSCCVCFEYTVLRCYSSNHVNFVKRSQVSCSHFTVKLKRLIVEAPYKPMKPTSFKLNNRDNAHDISHHAFVRLAAVKTCNLGKKQLPS